MQHSAAMTGRFFELRPEDKAFLPISCRYIGGKMMVVRAIEHKMILLAGEPSLMPVAELREKVKLSAMVPAQISESLQVAPERLEQIDILLAGGAAVSDRLKSAIAVLNHTSVYETYGMTETISHIALRRINGKQRSEWFTALPGVEVSPDLRNCLVVSAPGLVEGRLITNDIAEFNMRTAGQFRILGRVDNVINSGGIKISPEPVEEAIRKLSGMEVLLWGMKDEKWGERLVLIVEDDKVPPHLPEQLKAALPAHLVPRQIVAVPVFVRTENGKIRRTETAALIEGISGDP